MYESSPPAFLIQTQILLNPSSFHCSLGERLCTASLLSLPLIRQQVIAFVCRLDGVSPRPSLYPSPVPLAWLPLTRPPPFVVDGAEQLCVRRPLLTLTMSHSHVVLGIKNNMSSATKSPKNVKVGARVGGVGAAPAGISTTSV